MKIKQSFIDRCGEITIKQLKEISYESQNPLYYTLQVISDTYLYEKAPEVIKATATVLKIDLSDIYEVEQTPNTLFEKL